jgi:hypothetical protein
MMSRWLKVALVVLLAVAVLPGTAAACSTATYDAPAHVGFGIRTLTTSVVGASLSTTASVDASTYDASTLPRVDDDAINVFDAGPALLGNARARSAPPSAAAQGTSSTRFVRNIATDTEVGGLDDLAAKTTNAVGGLSDDVVRLAESNITASGETVLGGYPGYITKANSRGASYFDIGDTWNTLTPAQRTAANNHFLDVISARGDRVLLSTPKTQIQAGTALADEIAYLTGEEGYVWANQWSLRPGG